MLDPSCDRAIPSMSTFVVARLVGLLLLGSIFLSCGQPPSPPNILLVTIDTLRADHLATYGYPRRTSPFIDSLAAEGGVFEIAYATTATTGPSHASLFTGLYPDAHGISRNGELLSDELVTLPEHLRAKGYATGAVVSQFALNGKFGWTQGFDSYDDQLEGEPSTRGGRNQVWEKHEVGGRFDQRATAATDAALAWLAHREPTRPFFLWVHYFDPHAPYDPPKPHRSLFSTRDSSSEQRQIDLYDGEIHYTDDELRRLHAEILRLDPPGRLLTLITADHGESLFEHGFRGHGVYLYEEQVRIPLIVHWPGQIPSRRIPAPVSLVDVLPMVLELVEPASAATPDGSSLARALRHGAPLDLQRSIFMQRRHYESARVQHVEVRGRKIAVRKGQHKLIDAAEEGTLELYALDSDPKEASNVASSRERDVSELQHELREWQRASRFQRPSQPGQEIGADDMKKLEALGYVR